MIPGMHEALAVALFFSSVVLILALTELLTSGRWIANWKLAITLALLAALAWVVLVSWVASVGVRP